METDLKIIQVMTNPLGQHWTQPRPNEITLTEDTATISQESFDKLYEYNSTDPSGVYVGKMWKRYKNGSWMLCYYDHSDKPNTCIVRHKTIIILD